MLSNTRIEKIYQPSRDELVLTLRSVGFSGKLLISAKSGFSRICLTDDPYDNPADPPTFCKLMRKYIGGAKIVDFQQQGLDRTVFIRLSCYNEMGDLIFPYLAVELFANRSNIILCEESGRIIDAIHRSDIESGTRLIQPGAKYEPLPPIEKRDPFNTPIEDLATAVIASGKPAASAFMSAIDGVSPLISRELAELAKLDGDLA
ncbi:MAG: NFACT family protein, partial [Clostridia bacterium]|nr:NFACT family protein [Clostridia bacterium]